MAHLMQIKTSGVSTHALDTLGTLLAVSEGYVWLDMSGADAATVMPLLEAHFDFHPVVIEDALQETHIPKLNEWFDYVYLILAGLSVNKDDGGYRFPEVDVFLGANYVVTYHHDPMESFDRLRELVSGDARFYERGPDYLLYRFSSLLASDYLAMIDDLHQRSLDLESRLVDEAGPSLLSEILGLRRTLRQLQFYIEPQRSVLRHLATAKHTALDQQRASYRFNDVIDHFNRIAGMAIVLSENLSSAMEMYLSLVNNRMSSVVKTLTIITTLVLPLTLLTSFFGMNFFPIGKYFEVWTSHGVFRVLLVMIVALPPLMLWWMRRNRWL